MINKTDGIKVTPGVEKLEMVIETGVIDVTPGGKKMSIQRARDGD